MAKVLRLKGENNKGLYEESLLGKENGGLEMRSKLAFYL